MGKPNLNREQRRHIKNLKKDELINWLAVYAMDCYNDGVRDAFMSMLLKLHDDFGFGNERILRLLKACQPWMSACMKREDNIDSNGIKEQLISEGIVCLLDTDL